MSTPKITLGVFAMVAAASGLLIALNQPANERPANGWRTDIVGEGSKNPAFSAFFNDASQEVRASEGEVSKAQERSNNEDRSNADAKFLSRLEKINPAEARKLIERLNRIEAADEKMAQRLDNAKRQLMRIAQNEPREVALSEDAIALLEEVFPLTSPTQPRETKGEERFTKIKSVLAQLKDAIAQATDAAPRTTEKETAAPAAPTVPAAVITVAEVTVAESGVTNDIQLQNATPNVPLAQPLLSPEPLALVAPPQSTPPEVKIAVQSVGDATRANALEQLIPALTPAPTSKTDAAQANALSPAAGGVEVELPKLAEKLPASTQAQLADALPEATSVAAGKGPQKLLSAIEQKLQALDAQLHVVAPAAPLPVFAAEVPVAPQITLVKPEKSLATAALGAVESAPSSEPITLASLNGNGLGQGVGAPSFQGVMDRVVNHAPIREQVQVAVTKAAKDGIDQITIQLDPLGLGHVQVKLHTGQDGQTTVSFLIDKPETFDALSRDARGLERSLQESGLKTDSGSMQFNLRQQPQAQSDAGGDHKSPNHGREANAATPDDTQKLAAVTTRTYRVNIQDGLDIHA